MTQPGTLKEDEEPRSFVQRHPWVVILAATTVLGGAGFGVMKWLGSGTARPAPREVVMVSLPPPPPPVQPPPPPPQQQAPPEEKMIAQEPVNEPEPKAEEPPPVADDPPDLGTSIQGNGPADGFGLRGGPGNGRVGRLGGPMGKPRSKWGWYASQVQGRIVDSLRQNRRTRTARISSLQVRVWPDGNGRVTRAQLASSTGDAAMDAAIQQEVLTGLQLPEPPPVGMPLPLVIKLSARRP